MARRPAPPPSPPRSRTAMAAVVLFGLVPAAFLPGALDRFVFPKLAVAAAGVAVALVARPTGRLPRAVVAVVATASVVLLVAAVAGGAPLAQVIGRAPRYEGVVTLAVYLGCLAAGARLLRDDVVLRSVLLRATVVVAVGVAVLAAIEATGVHPLATTAYRPGSLVGNATDQGAYGVLVAGLCLPIAARGRDPWAVVGLVAGSAGVVLSASRGALVGLVVAVGVVVVASPARVRRAAGAAVGAATVASLAVPLTRRRLLLQSPLSHRTITGRATEWHGALTVWAHHPVLGVGPSGFVDAYPKVQSAGYVARYGSETLDSPHDLALQALLAGGPLLLLLALTLVALVVRAGWARRGDPLSLGLIAALGGYAVVLLTHFTSPATTPVAAVLGGGLLATTEVPRSWASRAVAGVAGLASAALVLAAVAEIPLRLGQRALARGQVTAAVSDLRVAHDLRPWDADLDAQSAEALAGAGLRGTPGASAAAAPFARRAERWVGDDPRLLLARAGVLLADRRTSDALAVLDRAHALSPQDVEVLVLRGVLRQSTGDLTGAVADLTAATVRDPHDPQPWRLLAAAYSAEGDASDAAAAAATATRLTG